MTTIVSVRRNGEVALGGDGQVTLGNTVMKGNAKKVRRLYHGKVLAGFAGGSSYENHLCGCLRSWQASYAISCPCVQPPARLWPLVLAALGGFH